MPTVFATENPSLPKPAVNEYGIKPDASYPGTVVTELMKAVEDEAALVVKEAFEEGYKAGRVEAAQAWIPVLAEARADAGKKLLRATIWTAIGAFLSGAAVAVAGCAIAR
jgi:hypothetical protein